MPWEAVESGTCKHGLGVRKASDLFLAVPFTQCVPWGEIFSISVSWFSYEYNGDDYLLHKKKNR